MKRMTWLGVIALAVLGSATTWIGCAGEETDEGAALLFQARKPPKAHGKSQPPVEPAPEPAPAPAPEPPPPDSSMVGWTELTPSADSLIVYVSASDGNDANNGLSSSTPKATITAGKALLRSGMPDWLLLKAGDTWTGQNFGSWTQSGRSESEPMVISSYGSGARPLIRTGTSTGIVMQSAAVSHLFLVGLHLQPHQFTGAESCAGIRCLTTCDDLLVEDCLIEGFKDNFVIQANNGPGTISNFRLRRSVVVDAYSSTSSHSQGLYASYVDGLLIEECVFDHNGWQGGAGAPATMYNHNTYISRCSNVTLRGNLFLRASSIGNKFRSAAAGESQGLLVENNFYIEGEIGISLGGNESASLRFTDVTVRDNVMMHIGRTQPTGRAFSFYLDVQDWDGGTIENNLLLYQPLFSNAYGIRLGGQSERNIAIRENILYALKDKALDVDVEGSETGISFIGNQIQDPFHSSQLIEQSGSFSGTAYQDNVYFTNASSSAWFRVDGATKSYAQWLSLSGETGSSAAELSYPDPGRDEESYQASLGGTPTLAAFAAEARRQSKANWRAA